MTTPAGHSLFGLAVFLAAPPTARKAALILLALLMVAAFIPDLDLLPILWGGLEAANNSHQQFTHSLLFTAVAALALAFVASMLRCGGFLRLTPYFIAAAWSHILLDFFTEDTRKPIGLDLLWPFSDARFSSPVSIFGGLAKSRMEDLLSWHNVQVVAGEIMVLAPLVAAIWLLRLRRERGVGRDL
jgi:membrane-bound metal-dependent hydrolase YbcI (DUF457 family)